MIKKALILIAALSMAAGLFAQQAPSKKKVIQTQPQKAPLSRTGSRTKSEPIPSGPPPKASVVGEMVFEAGTVAKGSQILHTFTIKNSGVGTLEIARVQPSCGCTLVNFDKKIAPGATGKVTLKVDTSRFNGPIHKTASVNTNDPSLRVFQLKINAVVKPFIQVDPRERQNLPIIYQGQDKKVTFTLTSTDKTPFKIDRVEPTSDKLDYDIKKVSGTQYSFDVTVPKSAQKGPVNGSFKLITTHPKAKTVDIFVSGTVRDPFAITPSQVVFPGMSRDFIKSKGNDPSLTKAVLVAKETQPADFKVVSAKSSLGFVKVTVKPLLENRRYQLQIKLDGKAPAGAFSGTVTLTTNQEDRPTITIPVRGRIF